jgi:hypothetical protein
MHMIPSAIRAATTPCRNTVRALAAASRTLAAATTLAVAAFAPSAALAVQDGPVEGRGLGVPLPIALGMIVPDGVPVDVAVPRPPLVDWTGGTSWQASLAAALAPHGLVARIAGGRVVVAPAPAASAVTVPPSAETARISVPPSAETARISVPPSAETARIPVPPPAETARIPEPPPAETAPTPEPPPPSSGGAAPPRIDVEVVPAAVAAAPAAVPAAPAAPAARTVPASAGSSDTPPSGVERRGDASERLAAAPPEAASWTARQGSTLRGTLEGWARAAGWTGGVVWHDGRGRESLRDYPIVAAYEHVGTFADAVVVVVNAFAGVVPPPRVVLHSGNRTVEVIVEEVY